MKHRSPLVTLCRCGGGFRHHVHRRHACAARPAAALRGTSRHIGAARDRQRQQRVASSAAVTAVDSRPLS